ncbi:MAG: hypothetical protein ACK4FA_00140 [Candidatus Paceibacteria bacterium]
MKPFMLFLALFSFAGLKAQTTKPANKDVTAYDYKDMFLVNQWVLKNPDSEVRKFTKSFTRYGETFYYLPREFWQDTASNKEIKEFIRNKFLIFVWPYAIWFEQYSGISRLLPITMAARETAWGTSERYARSGGELFSIKQKKFQRELGFSDGFCYRDDKHHDTFVQLWFGHNQTTLYSFQLYLLSITQDHYTERLPNKGAALKSRVAKWRNWEFDQTYTLKYSAQEYLDCLCGHESFNWATNCEGYEKSFKVVEKRINDLKSKKLIKP